MTITNGYITLAQFKQRASITTADTARDDDLELVITAACRAIDRRCGRVFYASTTDETRYYTAETPRRCYIDDLLTITTLKTDDDGDGTIETTWATTDYRKLPNSTGGWPYMWLEIMPEGDYTFPAGLTNGVEIVGTFGWTSVPDEVREAAFLQSLRLYQRRTSPFAVAGVNDFGPVAVQKIDPDIEALLSPYVRLV